MLKSGFSYLNTMLFSSICFFAFFSFEMGGE